MALTPDQQRHLEASWQNIQQRTNDVAAAHKNELIGKATATNNRAALPIAYSEAELYRLELTVKNQLEWTVSELEIMGVVLDDQAEAFVMKYFNLMTSMSMPLHFPPGLQSFPNISANQSAHAQAHARLNNQLQREAKAAITSLKLKARPAAQPTYAVTFQNNNSPGARNYFQSTDGSINPAIPQEIAGLLASVSHDHQELITLAQQVNAATDNPTRAKRAMEWLTALSTVEGLVEKAHTATPTLVAWIHHLMST